MGVNISRFTKKVPSFLLIQETFFNKIKYRNALMYIPWDKSHARL